MIPPRPSGRVLLVEDDPASAALLAAILRQAGHAVDVLEDGTQGLRAISHDDPPDILLLDWMLPGISGLDLCFRARERWDPLTLPILMVTARTDAESISAAFDAGASDYITKPVVGSELRSRVSSHLRTRRLSEERRRMEERMGRQEKLSAMGLLASGVAHDLASPLSGIAGFAQLLLQGEEDEQKRADLQEILAETDRCRKIVDNVLSFVRTRPARKATVDLRDIVTSTLRLCRGELASEGITPDVVGGERPFMVSVDEHQIQQVFLNIVVNARHALAESGSTLRIEMRGGTDEPVVEVFNDAPPIPDDVLPRIFEPFFTTKGASDGTGLGLAIARRVIEEHGGDITVESGPDGTTFRIRLPGLDAEAPTAGSDG